MIIRWQSKTNILGYFDRETKALLNFVTFNCCNINKRCAYKLSII